MIITCQQCETSFNLDEGILKPAGSKVRCSKCKHIFVAYPPAQAEKIEEALAEPAGMDMAGEDAEETAEADASPETKGAADEEELDFSILDEDPGLTTEPEETTAAEAEEEFDLSDLDKELKLMDEAEETAADEPGGEDLSLDFDLDVDEKEPASAETGEEELDLAGFDEEPSLKGDTAQAATDEPGGEDLSLDFDLDMDEKEPASAETGEEELDLAGLDEALSPADEPAPAAADAAAGEDLSLDFDLDMDEKEPASAETGEEELDLAGLDEELSLADEPEPATAGDDMTLDLDLNLEEKEPVAAEGGEEELDLTDIESMLEEGSPAGTAKKTIAAEEGIEVETEEIDLSELEKMLEADEESEPAEEADGEPEDLELDLDIDIEPEPETTAETGGKKTVPEAEDLDLTDLDAGLELDETPEAAAQAGPSEDLELEFITEELPEEELRLDEVAEEPVSDDAAEEILMAVENEPVGRKEAVGKGDESERQADEKVVDKRRRKAVAPKPKKRVSPLLIVLLVIVLLIGGVVMLPTFGIRIPYVGDLIKNIPVGDYLRNIPYVGNLLGAKADERGNLKMTTSDIDSKFIENAKSGTLFVISGKVRNGYDHPRGFVKVTGRLYSKGKKLAKVQTVFCGNILTDKELSSLDMEAVRKKLLVRTGQKQSNVRVAPGMQVPFMMVFSNLPPDLEEFDIQIEESLSAS